MTKRQKDDAIDQGAPVESPDGAPNRPSELEAIVPAYENQPARFRKANELHSRVVSLLNGFTDRAFESGKLLLQIKENKYFEELGHASFKEYLKSMDKKKSTAYSNVLIASKFNQATHSDLGIGRLRLLASLKDPLKVLEKGIPFHDGEICEPCRPVKDLKCDELRKYLRKLKDQTNEVEQD